MNSVEKPNSNEKARLLCSLSVTCIARCEDGSYNVYEDRQNGRFTLAGSWALIGSEDDPPESLKPRLVYSEGNNLASISGEVKELYGESFWAFARIAFLNPRGVFSKQLFAEWKELGIGTEAERYPLARNTSLLDSYKAYLKKMR